MKERRKPAPGAARRTFAALAREALEKNVRESRQPGVHWGGKANLGWMRWRESDGHHVFLALRRHLDWVTGEIGVSPDPDELEALELRAEPDRNEGARYRVRLGHLLHDEDQWWPARGSTDVLEERLHWLALQMGVKLGAFLRQSA